jgi:hypothetical protein
VSTPTVAELDAATAATEAAIESGDMVDTYLAAEAEEALYAQVFTGPCDTPAHEADSPEPELEAGQ